jgi:hypothetical protein
MKTKSRLQRKSYALQRMATAIERAVEVRTSKEKERAARWVAAWGLLCGIKTSSVRLRSSDVARPPDDRRPHSSDPISIPSAAASPVSGADAGGQSPPEAPQQLPLAVDQAGAATASGIFEPAARS